jgi:zinc protease
LNAAVKQDGILQGIEALITESNRISQSGFTQSELDRARTNMLRQMEQLFLERDKTDSRSYASEYSRNFRLDEPIPGIEYELMITRALLPEIELNEINELSINWKGMEERVILVNGPEKEGFTMPSPEEIAAKIDESESRQLEAYVDESSDMPLLENIPAAGRVISENEFDDLGVTEWKLDNGITVVLKPTDFKNDEIIFRSFSAGGSSLHPDTDYMSANVATDIIRESGIGKFSYTDLYKKLTGKVVSVFPYINTLSEGLIGSSSPEDAEIMFQLIHLYISSPRKDQESFDSYINRLEGFIQNRNASPETAFYDTIQVTMAQYHRRERPWSDKQLTEIELNRAFEIYEERFADAGDFTFFFVGNFENEKIKPLVEIYLGSLPNIPGEETWNDLGIGPPGGIVKKNIYKGLEQVSQVYLAFTGTYSWSLDNNYAYGALVSSLNIKLREVIREELGGTYGVRVSGSKSKYPRERYNLGISFGCKPERADSLIEVVFQVIDSVQKYGVPEEIIQKVRESQRRNYETSMKENGFWLRSLYDVYYYRYDPSWILVYPEKISSLTPEMVKVAAMKYVNRKNFAQFILYPEKE